MAALEIIAQGLSFPEGPRWHQGSLYFSDFYRQQVLRLKGGKKIDDGGQLEEVAHVAQQPSGLGWLPDGRLLIVSMVDRKVLRQEADGHLVVHADLSALASWHCNDMVVDSVGRAYVGHFGFDTHGEPVQPRSAQLIRIDPDGQVSIAADNMAFPNGAVFTADGRQLIVAETRAQCLTAFDVATDGSLSNRRIWADVTGYVPDGLCIDSEGMIWLADPANHCVLRLREGGEMVQRIDCPQRPYACVLGGENLRRLFICTATGSGPHAKSRRDGRIEAIDVDVPALA